MEQDYIEQLRVDLLSGDHLTQIRALRKAVEAPSETVVLLPEIYLLCRSDFLPNSSTAEDMITVCYRGYAAPFLLELLESDSPENRRNAIKLLTSLGRRRSPWGIVEQILDDRSCSLPDWGEYYPDILLQLYRSMFDSNASVRFFAAIALDEIGQQSDNILKCLIDGLSLSDPMMQNLAALHLGRLGLLAKSARPALQAFVKLKPQPETGTCRPFVAAKQAIRKINQAERKERDKHKNDISIGDGKWIEMIDVVSRRKGAFDIDKTIAKVEDFWKATETECVAACCGIDAFGFWPEEMLKATEYFDVKTVLISLRGIRNELSELDTDVFVSERLNNYFDKKVFLRLLDHIIGCLDKYVGR